MATPSSEPADCPAFSPRAGELAREAKVATSLSMTEAPPWRRPLLWLRLDEPSRAALALACADAPGAASSALLDSLGVLPLPLTRRTAAFIAPETFLDSKFDKGRLRVSSMVRALRSAVDAQPAEASASIFCFLYWPSTTKKLSAAAAALSCSARRNVAARPARCDARARCFTCAVLIRRWRTAFFCCASFAMRRTSSGLPASAVEKSDFVRYITLTCPSARTLEVRGSLEMSASSPNVWPWYRRVNTRSSSSMPSCSL